VILTIDLGTSVTKAALWDDTGARAWGRAELDTSFGPGGRVEQDPGSWWASMVTACQALAVADRDAPAQVDAICFSAARQTFVPVDGAAEPIGAGILWSDRRASGEAAVLAASLGGVEAVRQRTGMVLDGAAVAAKIAWLHRHEPERLDKARWLLSPRDLAVWWLTREVATDPTLATASGLYDAAVQPVAELVGEAAGRLPDVVLPATVVGVLRATPAGHLGLPVGIPVVVGAGDRACEVIGTAASPTLPMLSWGTTANVSVPVDRRPATLPPGLVATAGALGGWLLEGGLSAAGSLLTWLGQVTATDVDTLMAEAARCAPGARGVTATPWLGGARAPWWRDEARAAFVGLGFEHDRGDLARAAVEAIAHDAVACMHAITDSVLAAPTEIGASGHATNAGLWLEILAAMTGLPVVVRQIGEAASAGAAIVGAGAAGGHFTLDEIDPVREVVAPDPGLTADYRELLPAMATVAMGVLALAEARTAPTLAGPRATSPDPAAD
jgi:xylulokinase